MDGEGTAKYNRAVHLGKPLVSEEWVRELMKQGEMVETIDVGDDDDDEGADDHSGDDQDDEEDDERGSEKRESDRGTGGKTLRGSKASYMRYVVDHEKMTFADLASLHFTDAENGFGVKYVATTGLHLLNHILYSGAVLLEFFALYLSWFLACFLFTERSVACNVT